MNEVSRTAVTDTPRVPPIVCAPWCKHGDGHPNVGFVEDQFCVANGERIELTREAPELFEGAYYRHEARVYLGRDDMFSEPYMDLGFDDDAGRKLTRAESMALVEQILRLWSLEDGAGEEITSQRLAELVDGVTARGSASGI